MLEGLRGFAIEAVEASVSEACADKSEAVELLMSRLPDKYTRSTMPEDRARHAVLVQRLLVEEELHDGRRLVMEWQQPRGGAVHAKLYAVFRDRLSSLSSICAILSDLQLDIAEALVFCTSDGIAVDTFVCTSTHCDLHDHGSYTELLTEFERRLVEPQPLPPSTADTPHTPHTSSRSTTPAAMRRANATGASHGEASVMSWPWPSAQRALWDERQFEGLTLTRFCAEGSESKVWEACWGAATVAVKVLKDEPHIGKDTLKGFMKEVEIWRSLRHPHICTFMGTCLHEGRPAMVLEFMKGGSLHELLHDQGSGALEAEKKGSIALEVASGLAYLHSQDIIHRDIKAANILLDEQQHAKVTDFGISRTFGGDLTAETGTYRAMAPEVISHQAYDFKCDIYSFGILLWELMHQQMPFYDYSPLQAAFAVAMEKRRPPIALNKELESYGPLISRCWQHRPDARPESDEVVCECSRLFKDVSAWSASAPAPKPASASAFASKAKSLRSSKAPRSPSQPARSLPSSERKIVDDSLYETKLPDMAAFFAEEPPSDALHASAASASSAPWRWFNSHRRTRI